jgi:hypothetical protein
MKMKKLLIALIATSSFTSVGFALADDPVPSLDAAKSQLAEPSCTQESTHVGLKTFGPEIVGYDDAGKPIYKSSTAN